MQNPSPTTRMPRPKRGGYFGPESLTWKMGAEAALTLGGTRAVLMQIAHPLVAEGVYRHSSYMSDPLARTEHTFTLGQFLAFGSTARAQKAARTINHLHTHVQGTLSTSAGAYDRGTVYQARDPELLLWVHATLVDSILLVYPLLFGPLSPEEQDRYYQESKTIARLLGLSASDMPASAKDLRSYVNDMVHSNRLAATPQARQLAHTVLFPPIPNIFRPLLHLNLQFTCAILPPPVRAIYGLEWSTPQQRAFDVAIQGMRGVLPRLPMALRMFPITRRLMQEALG